ncbi:MAG: enoyl-CoA hydratase/isomerase family protein [Boseongicola sp.]
MSDIAIRKIGRTGRITLDRPDALNALTLDMVRKIYAVLPVWASDDEIDMLVLDANGDKAFCAGGDIADIYQALIDGDYETVRGFWREEYPLNSALFQFPKPVASFLQGFTMGGGVGIGCHASHRVVCETSEIAMPECTIGLVPDVGGSLLLSRAPGRTGEYLGATGKRMSAGDAIFAGFADYYLRRTDWPALIECLESTGDWTEIDRASHQTPESQIASHATEIDEHFAGETLRDIVNSLKKSTSDWALDTLEVLNRNAPLSMACAIEMIHRARAHDMIDQALKTEFRFVHRIAAQGDFLEGIRAAIIDKDRSPHWQHSDPSGPTLPEIARMLQPLGRDELNLEV